MIFNILQGHTKITLLALFVVFLLSFFSFFSKKNIKPVLQASFSKIYYAKYALDFPHTKNALKNCMKYHNKSCLEVYQFFKAGKNSILSLSDDGSLNVTLDIIEQACLPEAFLETRNVCYGGIMSLYFYNSPTQDKKILTRVREYPKAIKSIIFNNYFFWFHNRPNHKDWVSFISTLDINWELKGQKEFVLSMFKKNISEIDGEPWVLR